MSTIRFPVFSGSLQIAHCHGHYCQMRLGVMIIVVIVQGRYICRRPDVRPSVRSGVGREQEEGPRV
jgi:hypothetical protein